uniref:Uncharacterized protein LOC114334125 n=1 Tax=Diabrotica virgifera virgifera TaxID=50390 RepID=A0A6P7FUF5_DIAVI
MPDVPKTPSYVPFTGTIQEFVPGNSDWTVYRKRLSNYLAANNISDENRKCAILLSLLNEEAYKLLFNMCIPDEPEIKTFKELVDLIDEHFKSIKSVFSNRENFFISRKMANESAKEWAARLRSLVVSCEFGGAREIEQALVNQFIIGYDSGTVKDRLYEEKSTVKFSEVVQIASAKSVSFSNLQVVKKEPEIAGGSSSKSKQSAHVRASTSQESNFDAGGRSHLQQLQLPPKLNV